MKVYIVTESIDYMGDRIIAVFAKQEDAWKFCEGHHRYSEEEYDVIESKESK